MDEADTVDHEELARLLDEAACRRVLARYGPALDWRDPAALASTVWPDAIVDYGFFRGTGEEYVRAFLEIERAAVRPFHMLVCEHVAVEGSHAHAESFGIALTIETAATDGATARQYWGRYLDELEKREKQWRISKRTYLVHGVFDVATPSPGSVSFGDIYVATDLTVKHPLYRSF